MAGTDPKRPLVVFSDQFLRVHWEWTRLTTKQLRSWLELIGIFGVLLSLLFVGFQLKQDKELGMSEVVGSWTSRKNDVRQAIADNADTWRKACLGEELTKTEEMIARGIWDQYAVHQFSTWIMSRQGALANDRSYYLAPNNMALHLVSFPALQQLGRPNNPLRDAGIEASPPEWVSGFGVLINERLEKLKDLDADQLLDVSECGLDIN